MNSWRALAAFLVVEFVSYGLGAPKLGFYHDDWWFLEVGVRAGGFLDQAAAFARSETFWGRPLNILFFPALIGLGGLEPLFYHGALILLEAVKAWLFYEVLRGLTGRPGLSAGAAALSLMVPHRAATHLWFSNAPQTLGLALTLAAMAAHQRWMASGRRAWLAAGQLSFFLGLMAYESGAFLPLMLAGGLWAARRSVRPLWPFAATLAAALLWQRVGAVWLSGLGNPKTISFSLGHFARAFGAGFECLTNRVLHLCWTMAVNGPAFDGNLIPPCVLTAVTAARFWPAEEGRAPSREVLGALAGGFLGGYLPYALSGSYMPQVFGIMGRTNAGGSLVFGLGAASAIALLRRPLARQAAAGLLAAVFAWTNWAIARDWIGAWTLQQDILAKARPKASALPHGATVLLKAPGFVGHAIAFDASWDFGPALRLVTGRDDLKGDVVRGDPPPKGAYVFDYAADRLEQAR